MPRNRKRVIKTAPWDEYDIATNPYPEGYTPQIHAPLLKTINQQFNQVWINIKKINPHFVTRWRDYHKYTPPEVTFCRDDLIEQIFYKCSLQSLPEKRKKYFLNIYDVYTGTGSDFISFLTLYPKKIYGNTVFYNKDILQQNLFNFEYTFKKKYQDSDSTNMASVMNITLSKKDMMLAHKRINATEDLHVLYLDAPWKLPQTPLNKARAEPEEIMDAILEWVIEPLQNMGVRTQLIIIKGKWTSDIMSKLCAKLQFYEHILTVTTAPFKNEFQFHFLQFHPEVKQKHMDGHTHHVADLQLINSKVFHKIYSIPRSNKENIIPPLDSAPDTEYQLQILTKDSEGNVITHLYNRQDDFTTIMHRYNISI